MSVQFEWQAGSDDGQWQTIATAGRGPGRRWLGRAPWWAWVVVALVFTGLGALGYGVVRRRYQELQRQVEFQIQSVIDLEARAFARGDVDLFLDQQDAESSEWYTQQARRIREDCSASLDDEEAVRDPCAPVQPAKIENLNLQGDVAWVEVVEGQQKKVRKVRFYRQTDLGWKQTAPRAAFWKTAIRVQYEEFSVQYHKRDMPDIVFLEELIATTFAQVCATTSCPAVNTLIVDFGIDPPVYQSPYLIAGPAQLDVSSSDGRDRLVLSSPWLSGIPVEGSWDEEYVERLAHAVAYATTARAMRSTTRRDLNPLREAVADEYAAWVAGVETGGLPLLGPIIERRGVGVVPALLRSAQESRTSTQFLDQWLGLSLNEREVGTDRARVYFETLLNLERQALRAGRQKTFLMFQDTEWHGAQARYFYVQRSAGSLPDTEVRVRGVQISQGHARVQVEEPLPAFQGLSPQSFQDIVYFRLQDGDWRHASVMDAFFWTLQPAPTPAAATPRPSPAPTPNPGS